MASVVVQGKLFSSWVKISTIRSGDLCCVWPRITPSEILKVPVRSWFCHGNPWRLSPVRYGVKAEGMGSMNCWLWSWLAFPCALPKLRLGCALLLFHLHQACLKGKRVHP